MKNILFAIFFLMVCGSLNAQMKVTKPAAKKTTTTSTASKSKSKSSSKKNAKKIKTSDGGTEFEEVVCYEDGPCTFNVLKGDTLVYEVNASGKHYNLMVVTNKFDAATIADFNWVTSAPDSKAGHVSVNTAAITTSKKYLSSFPAGELKLSDASSIWLTSSNFKEIAKGQTTLTFDNSAPEKFNSPEADAVSVPVNYKGRSLNLEGFALENKPEGQADRKEIWVLNVSSNPLIIKMDVGWTMELKEVREGKK
ncbi:MAG: hypothetical protein C5B52_14335 [Bacteroidetes bacterium]|nr:MAG: hypothetical protein C5B52_14335 [Bacteroidota bacterium]